MKENTCPKCGSAEIIPVLKLELGEQREKAALAVIASCTHLNMPSCLKLIKKAIGQALGRGGIVRIICDARWFAFQMDAKACFLCHASGYRSSLTHPCWRV
jgi:hypothetical protein